MHDRLRTGVRGHWTAQALLYCATVHGHASLGLEGVGIVTLDPASPRTAGAGADEHAAVFAATAADVTEVVIDGQAVFDGDHARVGRELEAAIAKVWA
jgi:cytosine/adenosine deaminase-related metal-dependent hydrolase